MSITRFAVHRPITTCMASLVVVILGGIALWRLPLDLMPDLTFPTISVTTIYMGAGPEEIETTITRPLEQAISSVPNIDRIQSSSSEGSSQIRVRFRWGTDLDSVMGDVRSKIEQVRKNLPLNIEPPYIRRYDVADSPIIYLGLSSLSAMQNLKHGPDAAPPPPHPSSTDPQADSADPSAAPVDIPPNAPGEPRQIHHEPLSPVRLTYLAEKMIQPRIEQLDGVASIQLRGDVRREIQVNLNRHKLESLQMGIDEVVSALQKQNLNLPAGDFEQGYLRLLVRSHGEFETLQQIENSVIRVDNGAVVRIRDVADVVDGEQERTELVRINQETAMILYVFKQAGANTIAVSDRVRAAVEKLNRELQKEGASLVIRIDRSNYIRNAIADTRSDALTGAILAVVVLIVFLQSVRSSLVIAVAIPLAVLATFALLYFQGFTLNLVTLGGLALGTGTLIDNAIVVLESIHHKRSIGQDRFTAAIEGTDEVASAIIASTVTTVIVFLPLIFMQGITGVLLSQLAWVVGFSNVCALFASLTLTPVLTAYWMGDTPLVVDDEAETGIVSPSPVATGPAGTNGLLSRLGSLMDHIHAINRSLLSLVERTYAGILRFSLRHQWGVGLLLWGAFTCSLGLSPFIGTEFVPKADEGDLRVEARMAPGIQLQELSRQSALLEKAIAQSVHEAINVSSFVGGRREQSSDWNRSQIRIVLSPRDQRRHIEDIRKDLAAKIPPIPGAQVRVAPLRDAFMFSVIRQAGGSSSDLDVQIRGYDLADSQRLALDLIKLMQEIPGLINVKLQKADARPELGARIDRAKASLMGINMSQVSQTLETTIRGTEATLFREKGDEYVVLVRLREDDRKAREDLGQVSVSAANKQLVPLKNLVDFEEGLAPAAIDRLDQQRVVSVAADVEGRDLGSVVADLQQVIDERLPVPTGFDVTIAGDWEQQQESFAALKMGFLLAVVLMYMVMASQFESLRDPLLIMVSVPLAAVGVIVTLVVTNTTLNVQSFIGLIILAGIVVNNAIVLIDYLKQLRTETPDRPLDELVEYACVRRLRPILMTTLTTVLGMVPMSLGWGEGGELQAPMARVVIGGLTSSTIITLLAIPMLYHVFERRRLAKRPV